MNTCANITDISPAWMCHVTHAVRREGRASSRCHGDAA